MNEKSDRTANQLPLPALKPRARSDDPFSRNMAAIVESSISETGSLEQQTRTQFCQSGESVARKAKDRRRDSRAATRIPVSQMIELQVHCARNRTTMQEVVQGEFLARQPDASISVDRYDRPRTIRANEDWLHLSRKGHQRGC